MKRAVRSLIRLVAAGFVVFGALEICFEIAHHAMQVRQQVEPTTNLWHYLIGAGLLLVGAILFLGSESLAEQLTDDVDDTDNHPPNDPDDIT